MKSQFREWITQQSQIDLPCFVVNENLEYFIVDTLNEETRYSIDANYRTKVEDVLEAFAKIALGFASASMKGSGYHVKHVYTQKPLRILVSSRNWDDGEWVGVATWNPEKNCFVIGKGFYNKENKSISIQGTEKCSGESPAEVAKDLKNVMHSLKKKPDRQADKLKGVNLKRGPVS